MPDGRLTYIEQNYQVRYSTKKNMAKATKKTARKNSYILKKLKAKKLTMCRFVPDIKWMASGITGNGLLRKNRDKVIFIYII